MDGKNNIALDLDALAPANIQINFNGKLIQVTPPSLEQYIKVMDFADQMNKIEDKQVDYKNVANIFLEMKNFIYECIPDLKELPLNIAQITAIFELLSTLGAPSDKAIEELKARGINLKSENSSPKDLALPSQ